MHSKLRFTGLLLGLICNHAIAQVVDPYFIPPSGLYSPGIVYAISPPQSNGQRLFAGPFTRVNGITVNRLVRLDASGNLDLPFTQNVGNATLANRIKSLSTGQYLLSSSTGTITAGNLTRTALLRLNKDGTADAAFNVGSGPGTGGSVRDFAVQSDGKVVVVGAFTSFNGTAAGGVVRLTTTGIVDATFSTGTGTGAASGDLALAALAQLDGKLVVGGRFATFNGQPANGLVRLNTDGTLDPSFTSPFDQSSTQVEGVLQQPDGKLLVYGSLSINSTLHPSPGIVRLLSSGSLDPSFSSPTFLDVRVSTGTVNGPAAVLQPDGRIIVAGGFTVAGANHLARLNTDGTQDMSFQTGVGPSASPYAISLQANGSLLVGGAFGAYDGVETPLVQLTGSGTRDPAFAPMVQSAGAVLSMVRQPDNQLIIGGNFTEINGQPVHRLARISETGMVDATFAAATGVLPASVNSLALQADGRVLAGSSQGTARFLPTGSPDASFSFSGNTTVLAVQADGRILIGGNFGITSGGVLYNRLIRLMSTGSVDPTFARTTTGTGVPNSTDALLIQPDGRIVVAGTFVPPGQTVAARLVRYGTTGSLDATFNNNIAFAAASGSTLTSPRIYALALQPDGKIVAGGGFGTVDGSTRVNLARFTTAGTLDQAFILNAPLSANGNVQSIAYQPNGRLLVAGGVSCTGPNGLLYGLIRVLSDGQLDNSFGPSVTPNNIVASVILQLDGGIMIAGAFTSVATQPAFGMARVAANNVLHVVTSNTNLARLQVWPNPAHDVAHITAATSLQLKQADLLDVTGRLVRRLELTSAKQGNFDLKNLTEGIYLLRVTTDNGSFTSRIAIE